MELPKRMYKHGEEPDAAKSISYHSDNTKLYDALKENLYPDEYDELKESKLGLFIKFKEKRFEWASRLVHFTLCFQLEIKKRHELWVVFGASAEPARFSLNEFEHLTGLNCDYIENLENPICEMTEEMTSFWELMGVDIEAGPNTQQLEAALDKCSEWSRDDRMRLGYLSIYAGWIEGRKFSTSTRANLARLVMDLERFENYPWGRVAFKVLIDSVRGKDLTGCYTIDGFVQVLQVWTYFAMPEFGVSHGNPRPDKPSPPMLAFRGGKGRRCFKERLTKATKVIHFVKKDIGDMFPRWDAEVEDTLVNNLINLLLNGQHKWTIQSWEVSGSKRDVKMSDVMEKSDLKEKKKKKKKNSGVKDEVKQKDEVEEERTTLRPEKRPRRESEGNFAEEIRQSLKDMNKAITDGFGSCITAIKLLGERVEAVEKLVGVTKKGSDSDASQRKRGDDLGVSNKPSSKII